MIARQLGDVDQSSKRDDVCGLLVRSTSAVGVDLHRGSAVGVPQSRRHGRDGHAGVEQLRRLEVPKIMEANAVESDGRPRPLPSRVCRVGTPRGGAGGVVGEHVADPRTSGAIPNCSARATRAARAKRRPSRVTGSRITSRVDRVLVGRSPCLREPTCSCERRSTSPLRSQRRTIAGRTLGPPCAGRHHGADVKTGTAGRRHALDRPYLIHRGRVLLALGLRRCGCELGDVALDESPPLGLVQRRAGSREPGGSSPARPRLRRLP